MRDPLGRCRQGSVRFQGEGKGRPADPVGRPLVFSSDSFRDQAPLPVRRSARYRPFAAAWDRERVNPAPSPVA